MVIGRCQCNATLYGFLGNLFLFFFFWFLDGNKIYIEPEHTPANGSNKFQFLLDDLKCHCNIARNRILYEFYFPEAKITTNVYPTSSYFSNSCDITRSKFRKSVIFVNDVKLLTKYPRCLMALSRKFVTRSSSYGDSNERKI